MQRQLINWDKQSNSFPLALIFLLFLKLYNQLEVLIVHIFLSFNICQKIKIKVFDLLFFHFCSYGIFYIRDLERKKDKNDKNLWNIEIDFQIVCTFPFFWVLPISVILSFHVHHRNYGGFLNFFGWLFLGFVWLVGFLYF